MLRIVFGRIICGGMAAGLVLCSLACENAAPTYGRRVPLSDVPPPSDASQTLSAGPIRPAYTPPPSSVRDMKVGERVEGVFGDGLTIRPGDHHFFTTVPGSGTLEVTLEWNPDLVGTLLMLRMEEQEFRPSSPVWSPVIGRLQVEAGKRYLVAVSVAGADWLPEDPFVLTSRLEP